MESWEGEMIENNGEINLDVLLLTFKRYESGTWHLNLLTFRIWRDGFPRSLLSINRSVFYGWTIGGLFLNPHQTIHY